MYRTYASNLPLAHGLINRLASSSPEFSTFLDVRCSPRPTATLRGRPLLTLQRFRGHPCPVARHQPTLWLPDAPAAAGLADQPHRPLRPALSRCAWLLENAVLGAYSDWRALCWARAVSDPVPSPALPLRSAAISTDGRQCPPPPPTHPPAKTPPPIPPSPLNPIPPTHPPAPSSHRRSRGAHAGGPPGPRTRLVRQHAYPAPACGDRRNHGHRRQRVARQHLLGPAHHRRHRHDHPQMPGPCPWVPSPLRLPATDPLLCRLPYTRMRRTHRRR